MFKLFKTIKSRQEESHGMSMFELTFYFLLLIVGLTFTIALTVWWLSPGHIPHNFSGLPHIFDYIIFGILTYALGYKIVNEIFTWEIAGTIKKPKFIEAPKGFRVAFLTAFVPKKESYAILENTLKAMVNNDYPHDTWLLDEGNDP